MGKPEARGHRTPAGGGRILSCLGRPSRRETGDPDFGQRNVIISEMMLRRFPVDPKGCNRLLGGNGARRESRLRENAHKTSLDQSTYILYFPRSSSFSPSSHFRSSSLVTRSDILVASFEVFRTDSSTKIGQSTRNARASASEGRESMLMTSPPRSSQMTA